MLAGVGAALLLVPAPASALQGTHCKGAEKAVKAASVAASERTLLCLLNVHRVANGRAVLTHDQRLVRAARAHSQYMEQTSQFAHQDIGDGTPQSRATAAGYPFAVGENIHNAASRSLTPSNILDALRADAPNNASMLDPVLPSGERIVYVTAGMGIAVGPNHGVTTTQVFGVGDGGATDTAEDLLTSPACETARASIRSAERAVAKAKRKLRNADTRQERAKARKRLRKAKKALAAAQAAEEKHCALTY